MNQTYVDRKAYEWEWYYAYSSIVGGFLHLVPGEDYYSAAFVCVSVAIGVVGVVDTAAVAAIVCRRFFLLGQIRVPLQQRAFQAP